MKAGIEKRSEVLYLRAKPSVKAWIREKAEERGVTESLVAEEIFERARAREEKRHASNSGKLVRG